MYERKKLSVIKAQVDMSEGRAARTPAPAVRLNAVVTKTPCLSTPQLLEYCVCSPWPSNFMFLLASNHPRIGTIPMPKSALFLLTA